MLGDMFQDKQCAGCLDCAILVRLKQEHAQVSCFSSCFQVLAEPANFNGPTDVGFTLC